MNKIKSILIVIVALLHASAVSAIDIGGCATARQMVKEKRYAEAIADFDLGLRYMPVYSYLYLDRALAYLETERYQEALQDYDRVILLDATSYKPFLGRAMVHEALGHPEAARLDYARSCQLGVTDVCANATSR